jgi:deoxyribodipyrimidine photo-lyase
MSKPHLTIYWVRRDFRLSDNQALTKGIEFCQANNTKLLPIYILDSSLLNTQSWNIGKNRKFYLSKVLAEFFNNFTTFKIFIGSYYDVFKELAKHYTLSVFVNEDIEPYSVKRDEDVHYILQNSGGNLYTFLDQITVNKNLFNNQNNFYDVFNLFRNTSLDEFLYSLPTKTYTPQEYEPYLLNNEAISEIELLELQEIKPNKQNQQQFSEQIFSLLNTKNILSLKHSTISIDMDNLIDINLDKIAVNWYFTESKALEIFNQFIDQEILFYYKQYTQQTNKNDYLNSKASKLSSAIKWGLISPRTMKELVLKKFGIGEVKANPNLFIFISELMWREFYRYISYHYPEIINSKSESKNQYNHVSAGISDAESLEYLAKWIKGETGNKIIDKTMKEIIELGWTHNKGRLEAARFLVQEYKIDMTWGQDYFRLMLVDLDEASNNGLWQSVLSPTLKNPNLQNLNSYLDNAKDIDEYNSDIYLIIDHKILHSDKSHTLRSDLESLYTNTSLLQDFKNFI